MLFTATSPARQGDRILLFLDPQHARASTQDGQPIFGVAVGLDPAGRSLSGEAPPDAAEDPNWTTPAYLEDFQSVMARGPIPGAYFFPLVTPACC